MSFFTRRKPVFLMVLFISLIATSAPIKRMDLFDNSGNSLMFVVFDYDENQNNTTRSIYTSDSTFLKKTTFTNDASGNRIKEHSLNFNDDTIGYTTFLSQNNRPTINVFDQFGLNQFGASVGYSSNGENTYDMYHNGAIVCKMNYTYSGEGNLTKVDIKDNSGGLLYYATFSSVAKTNFRSGTIKNKPTISTFSNMCTISLAVQKESQLKVCIYNISGQLLSVPFSQVIKPGIQSFRFRMFDTNTKISAGGLYVIRVLSDGQNTVSSHKYIATMGTR